MLNAELQSYVSALPILDTHEHLPQEAERPQENDVLAEYLRHYFDKDLVSAGAPQGAVDAAKRPGDGDLLARFDALQPWWDYARSTGYGRSLDITAKGLYGIDGVHRATLPQLDAAFRSARNAGGHYQRVLKEKSRISLSLLDQNLDCDRRFFASVARPYVFMANPPRENILRDGQQLGIDVRTLADWERAADAWVGDVHKKGAVAIKWAFAYDRSLAYPKVHRGEAERAFDYLMRCGAYENKAAAELLQNHMAHCLFAAIDAQKRVLQIHTGHQEGNGNDVRNANPLHLVPLFQQYRNVRFVLMHLGYPWPMELSSLAKMFANVYLDMAWGHIITPEGARRALSEWLDAVPANKICAFGGDYAFVDAVYGHQVIARENVTHVLSEKVAAGNMGIARAREVARWLLHDNAVRIFRLEGRLEGYSRPV